MAPLFLIRASIYRRIREEWIVCCSALTAAAIQLTAWKISNINFPKRAPVTIAELLHIILMFLGRYLVGNLLHDDVEFWIAGGIFLALWLFVLGRRHSDVVYWCISALFVICVAMAMRRAPVTNMHPALAGPRYFFFPFVLASWFLLQLVTDTFPRMLKVVGWGCIALSVVNAIPVLSRKHDNLYWRMQVFSCSLFDFYSIPIHYDGHAYGTWQLRLTGRQCNTLLSHDRLRNLQPPPLTFPYTVFTVDLTRNRESLASIDSLIGNGWVQRNPHDSRLSGVAAITAPQSEHWTRDVVLQLRKGQTVLYHTSPDTQLRVLINDGTLPFAPWLQPSAQWRYLNFSNALLPEHFTVKFVERGYRSTFPVTIGLAEN